MKLKMKKVSEKRNFDWFSMFSLSGLEQERRKGKEGIE